MNSTRDSGEALDALKYARNKPKGKLMMAPAGAAQAPVGINSSKAAPSAMR